MILHLRIASLALLLTLASAASTALATIPVIPAISPLSAVRTITSTGELPHAREWVPPSKLLPRDDEVWVVSTRGLGCSCGKDGVADLRVQRLAHDGTLYEATLSDFLAGDELGWTTVVYVHGNRISADEALDRGQYVYEVLAGDPAAPPLRMVIWSWPSDQIHGQLRDVRAKAARTNSEACYLAEFLAQISPATPLSLIGYSYGGRVVTGALADLAGGSVGGCACAGSLGSRGANMRVVLIAAAVHNYWLSPGGWHAPAWDFVDQLVLLYNSCDPVLRRYRFVDLRNRPQALGYAGACGLDDHQAARFTQYNVCCEVGKTHSEEAYWYSPTVVENTRQYALWLHVD